MKTTKMTYKRKVVLVDLGAILAVALGAAVTYILVRTANTILELL